MIFAFVSNRIPDDTVLVTRMLSTYKKRYHQIKEHILLIANVIWKYQQWEIHSLSAWSYDCKSYLWDCTIYLSFPSSILEKRMLLLNTFKVIILSVVRYKGLIGFSFIFCIYYKWYSNQEHTSKDQHCSIIKTK